MTNYRAQRFDPRWQQCRLKIMQRDGFKCRYCGDSRSTLNVHHRFYFPKRDIWDYPSSILVTLCTDCHGQQHQYGEDRHYAVKVWDEIFEHLGKGSAVGWLDLMREVDTYSKSSGESVDGVLELVSEVLFEHACAKKKLPKP